MKSQFALRDVFWFVLVIALWYGWTVDRHRADERHYRLWQEYLAASSDAFWKSQPPIIFIDRTVDDCEKRCRTAR